MSSVDAQWGSAASTAGNVASAEPLDISKARVAEYSHDNVFARIHARGENQAPGPGPGGNGQAEADLEAHMATSQPPAGQGVVAQADSSLIAVGSQFD